MTVVQETLVLPGGEPAAFAVVTVSLAGPDGAAFVSPDTSIVSVEKVRADVDGRWSLDLTPNDSIVPSGTTWRRTVKPARSTRVVADDYFSVPTSGGPYELQDLLVDPPDSIPSTPLAAHVASRGAGSHLPDGGDEYDIPIMGAGGVVAWGPQPGYASEAGSGPALHERGLDQLHDLLATLVADPGSGTPIDIMFITDSLGAGEPTWIWILQEIVASQVGTGPVPYGVIPVVSMDTVAGVANPNTTTGGGYNLSNGQVLAHEMFVDGWSVIWTEGTGTLTIRDGAGGTILGTIDTTTGNGSGNLWTSGALAVGTHTIHITSTGNTTVDAVRPHLGGTRAAGCRLWQSSITGHDSQDFINNPSQALDFVENVQPEVVVICTGTNDTGTQSSLLADAVAALAPDALIVGWVPPPSAAINPDQCQDIREAYLADGRPTVDMDRWLAVYEAAYAFDTVHPTVAGRARFAELTWMGLGGDPFGILTRLRLDGYMQALAITGALGEEIRLVSGWRDLAEGGDGVPHMEWDTDGEPVQIYPTTGGGLAIDPQSGAGMLEVAPGAGGTAEVRLWANTANPYAGLSMAAPFSIPILQWINQLTGASLGALACTVSGQIRAGLSADQMFHGGFMRNIRSVATVGYTVVAADATHAIVRANGGASTMTWPTDAAQSIPVGTEIPILNNGAGTITHSCPGGVITGTLTQAQNVRRVATKTAANTWFVA